MWWKTLRQIPTQSHSTSRYDPKVMCRQRFCGSWYAKCRMRSARASLRSRLELATHCRTVCETVIRLAFADLIDDSSAQAVHRVIHDQICTGAATTVADSLSGDPCHVTDRPTCASLSVEDCLRADRPRRAKASLPEVASRIVTGLVTSLCTARTTLVWGRRVDVMELLASGMASVCGATALHVSARMAATLQLRGAAKVGVALSSSQNVKAQRAVAEVSCHAKPQLAQPQETSVVRYNERRSSKLSALLWTQRLHNLEGVECREDRLAVVLFDGGALPVCCRCLLVFGSQHTCIS